MYDCNIDGIFEPIEFNARNVKNISIAQLIRGEPLYYLLTDFSGWGQLPVRV